MRGSELSILIPFRDTDGTRGPIKEWVTARWQTMWPAAELIVTEDDGQDPFSKSIAVNNAAKQATGRILAITDADIAATVAATQRMIDVAQDGGWAAPSQAIRLTGDQTSTLLAKDPTTRIAYQTGDTDFTPVGALHIMPRTAFDAVGGMDPRFRGWGGEDTAFLYALDTLWQPHTRIDGTVYELRHHVQVAANRQRIWAGQHARNDQLTSRYIHAKGLPDQMRSLQSEWQEPSDAPSELVLPGRLQVRLLKDVGTRTAGSVLNTTRQQAEAWIRSGTATPEGD